MTPRFSICLVCLSVWTGLRRGKKEKKYEQGLIDKQWLLLGAERSSQRHECALVCQNKRDVGRKMSSATRTVSVAAAAAAKTGVSSTLDIVCIEM